MSAVRIYLNFLTNGLNRAVDPSRDQLRPDTIGRILRAASTARLYEVSSDVYRRLASECAHEAVAAIRSAEPERDLTDVQGLSLDLSSIASQQPFTRPLPFPAIFLVFGGQSLELLDPAQQFNGEARLLGLLIFQDAEGVWIFEHVQDRQRLWVQAVHGPTGWHTPIGISMLCLPALVDRLMSPRVRERNLSTTERFEIGKASKKAKRRIPTLPYYTVDIDAFDDEPQETTGVRVIDRASPQEPDHRYDVSGHQRLLIKRGYGRPDPAWLLRHMLSGWEYWINDLPPRWSAQLAARGIAPKEPGEWMTLMLTDVSSHVRGPDDRPYLPAVRRLRGSPELSM